MSDQAAAAVAAGFPAATSDWTTDPRVSFSKVTGKWTFEADDGIEYEHDDEKRAWMPVADESLIEAQQKAYKVEGVNESATPKPNKKKRKTYTGEDPTDTPNKASKASAKDTPQQPRKNTAVYITGLPLDVKVDELKETFTRCGVIAEDLDTGEPRIKLYTDEQGQPKGDALVVYFREESVALAEQLLDDAELRLGDSGTRMRVQKAEYNYKKEAMESTGEQSATKKRSVQEKKRIQAKYQKLNNKLADWDEDDLPEVNTTARWAKVVILKHMFTLKEASPNLEEDPALMLELKEEIRDECSKLGPITNVILYDEEPEGVVSVRFSDEEAARACVKAMNGRWFGGAQVEAMVYDGQIRYRKSGNKEVEEGVERFGEWLEAADA
ncbi:hypothetical protein YB2330_001137 [Saitoella coloradoensis]